MNPSCSKALVRATMQGNENTANAEQNQNETTLKTDLENVCISASPQRKELGVFVWWYQRIRGPLSCCVAQ